MIYIVRRGDSLYRIARKFDLTVDEIKRANGMHSDLIIAGESLFLPLLPVGVYGIGAIGEAVRDIQQVLAYMGFPIRVDGIYGPQSANTIYYIQLKYPELSPDGIYGPKTKAYLERLVDEGYRIVQDPSDLLVLVNKTNALDPHYLPEDLVVPAVPFTIAGPAPQKQMRYEAARALKQLFAKAQAEGIDLTGVSAYRSYPRQAAIFRENWETDPVLANQFSARPGESEHQTGLAIDVSSPSVGYALTQAFGNTPEGKWLEENAPDFGFIIRYPAGKEHITGYRYEPWHIRYVGRDAAIAMSGSTLEEYISGLLI
ncbi:MAG: D-alanyl-D-alanine carboxypeptidase family protein [Bacillota bacterium]